MKVIVINGSPRVGSNTLIGLKEAIKVLNEEGIETELINIGNRDIRGCIACESCSKTGKCAFDDVVNEVGEKLKQADGLLVGAPVYFASPNATVLAFMQRLFYSTNYDKRMKVGASFACARRAGTDTTFDVLNKFFLENGVPIAASSYWNNIFGCEPNEAIQDSEGLQTARNLAHNMAFMIKSIALGKEKYGMPIRERGNVTNFIK